MSEEVGLRLYKHCYRCFRKLYSPKSIARGYGAVCYSKMPKNYEGRSINLSTIIPIPLEDQDQNIHQN